MSVILFLAICVCNKVKSRDILMRLGREGSVGGRKTHEILVWIQLFMVGLVAILDSVGLSPD